MNETPVVSLEQVETLLSNIEILTAQNSELLLRIYTCQLFAIGVIGAIGVLFLLYKFLKGFY